MAKVLLAGPLDKMYQIGNRQLQGGLLHDLSDTEVKNHGDAILAHLEKKAEKVEKKAVKQEKKLTEKEAVDLNKDEQVALLKKLGVEPTSKNNNLKLEKDRVKAILGAQ